MKNYEVTKIKEHESPRRGAYWADYLVQEREKFESTLIEHNGFWVISRPIPYKSFFIRLKQAIDVLRYRADALYWRQDHELSGKSS